MVSQDTALALEDRYPFKELWIRFYEENIGVPHLVKLLLLAWGNSIGDGRTKNQEVLYANAELLLGDFADFRVPQDRNFSNGYGSSAHTVLTPFWTVCMERGRKAVEKESCAGAGRLPCPGCSGKRTVV